MDNDIMKKAFGKNFHFDNNFWFDPIDAGIINVHQIGELCCEPGYIVEEHQQTVYEVTYVVSGSGYSYIDGDKIRLSEGTVLINSPGHVHAIEADSNDILRYTYMGFVFNEPLDADREILKKAFAVPWRAADGKTELLLPFMRCMDEFHSKAALSMDMVKNYCQQIVILAARSFLDSARVEHHSVGTRSAGAAVYSIIRYVENNIMDIVSVRDVSEKLGYSYTYISHLFKERTGTTLQNYITYKKIENSIQLLNYGDLSVTKIAEMLHYESVQSFSKAFSRVMGVTPTKYINSTDKRR